MLTEKIIFWWLLFILPVLMVISKSPNFCAKKEQKRFCEEDAQRKKSQTKSAGCPVVLWQYISGAEGENTARLGFDPGSCSSCTATTAMAVKIHIVYWYSTTLSIYNHQKNKNNNIMTDKYNPSVADEGTPPSSARSSRWTQYISTNITTLKNIS